MMNMKMQTILLVGCLAALPLFTGCGKLKDAFNREESVPELAFSSEAYRVIPQVSETSSADGYYSFSETDTINYYKLEGLSDDFNKKYDKSCIKSVTCQSATICLTAHTPGNATVHLRNLKISVEGIAPFLIPTYTFGETYTTEAATSFLEKLIMQTVKLDQVIITLSGETDYADEMDIQLQGHLEKAVFQVDLVQ
ncbi:MAG: hypothetical protein LBL81_01390 [Tannerella sp.]|jgi:hypothetical protein|nr:hypothetical protein [Tannerella sp.]